jgi:prepilin-type N-terminal cleavage/methylation domain-containing protein
MSEARVHHRRRVRAFTLIEMLVVIAVILILVALTVTVAVSVVKRSEIRETENLLRILDSAVMEWEMQAGRQITYGINGEPCPDVDEKYELEQLQVNWGPGPAGDQDAFADAELTTDRLWATLSRTATIQDIIARVKPAYIESDDVMIDNVAHQTFHFTDPWDREILAILPGRAFHNTCDSGSGYQRDADGTIRTPFENRFGAAANRRIFFVSAGPDGEFGNVHLTVAEGSLSPQQREDVGRAVDNVYSYPVLIDEARP